MARPKAKLSFGSGKASVTFPVTVGDFQAGTKEFKIAEAQQASDLADAYNEAAEAAESGAQAGSITFAARPKGETLGDYNGTPTIGKGNITAKIGGQRMPVSLYPAQWQLMFSGATRECKSAVQIAGLILVNADKLDFKSDADKARVIAWAKPLVSDTAATA